MRGAAPAEQVGCGGGGRPAGSGSSLWPCAHDPGPSGRPALLVYAAPSRPSASGSSPCCCSSSSASLPWTSRLDGCHPVSPAGLWQPPPPADSPPPCTSAVNSCPASSVLTPPVPAIWFRPCSWGRRARGQGQPAIPDQGYLLLLLLLIFCCCYRQRNQRHGRRQDHANQNSFRRANRYRRSWGRGRGLGGGGPGRGVGHTRTDGPVCPDLLSHPNQPPSLPTPPRRERLINK